MKSIKLKLIFVYVGVFIVMIGSGIIIRIQVWSSETQKAKLQLEEYAEKINSEIINGNKTAPQFQEAYKNMIQAPGIQSYVLDAQNLQTLAPA